MGIKFGEIDATQIIENEYRIGVLERIIELILQRSSITVIKPNEIQAIRDNVIIQLQKKYPNSGIALKGGSQ